MKPTHWFLGKGLSLCCCEDKYHGAKESRKQKPQRQLRAKCGPGCSACATQGHSMVDTCVPFPIGQQLWGFCSLWTFPRPQTLRMMGILRTMSASSAVEQVSACGDLGGQYFPTFLRLWSQGAKSRLLRRGKITRSLLFSWITKHIQPRRL